MKGAKAAKKPMKSMKKKGAGDGPMFQRATGAMPGPGVSRPTGATPGPGVVRPTGPTPPMGPAAPARASTSPAVGQPMKNPALLRRKGMNPRLANRGRV